MSPPHPQLTPLEARKQLLLVESEVNRAQLSSDWAAFNSHIEGWKQEVHSLSSTATALFSGVKIVRGAMSRGKASLVSTLFHVARSSLSLWGNIIARYR